MHVAEDVDLVLRLHAAGWRLRYEPTSRVAHDHRTRLRAWWLRKAYYGTGAAPLALRHRGAVPPMVLSPWSAAVAGALLARRPLVAARRWPPGPRSGWSPQLPELSRPWSAAARIVGLGAVGAVAQTADAVNRHYWPLAALACAVSARARRTVAAVALVEGLVDWLRHRDRDPRVRPGRSATSSRTGSTTSPTARGCGGGRCGTGRSSRCGRRARGSRGREPGTDTVREYCSERVN